MAGVVIAFGRLNPPTTGHAKLIEFAEAVATKLGARVIIFPSPTQEQKKNPLPFNVKVNFLKQMFPKVTFNSNAKVRTPFDALRACSSLGYRKVTVIVGSDRVGDFESFRRYIKPSAKKAKVGDVVLDEYKVLAVPGERDPDAEDDVSGMSASKMRYFADIDDFASFRQGTPTRNERLALQIFRQVRAFRGLR